MSHVHTRDPFCPRVFAATICRDSSPADSSNKGIRSLAYMLDLCPVQFPRRDSTYVGNKEPVRRDNSTAHGFSMTAPRMLTSICCRESSDSANPADKVVFRTLLPSIRLEGAWCNAADR